MKINFHFGNHSDSPITIQNLRTIKSGLLKFPNTLQNSIVILNQTHSVIGHRIENYIEPLFLEGDFIVTSAYNLKIGVLTADCLPIILYDISKNCCAIVHSGWRGSVKKILKKALETLFVEFNVDPKNIKIIFGPAAKVCCYQVSQDFASEFADNILHQSLVYNDKSLMFDNTKYSTLELMSMGVIASNIDISFNLCTICNDTFGSYRRLGAKSPLNLSWVKIKN